MRIRLTTGITFSEVAVSCLLLTLVAAMTGAGYKGRSTTERERVALSSMVAATKAILLYAEDNHGGLPRSDAQALSVLGEDGEGPGIASNECLSEISQLNPAEVVVLTAPVGVFVDKSGVPFRPARVSSTDSAAALIQKPKPAWETFQPEDIRSWGAAPYGTTSGAVRVWHPGSFRWTPIYKNRCSGSMVKGPMDRPTFVPAEDAAFFAKDPGQFPRLTAGAFRES